MSTAYVSTSMPPLDLVLYFLVGPALGVLGYLVSLVTASEAEPVSGPRGRIVLALLGIPSFMYGAVLVFVALPIPADPVSRGLTRAIGLAFSVVAILTLAGMSYQIRRIVPAIEREPSLLGRNLVLLVVPQSAVVFGLVLGIQQLGYLGLAYGPGPFPLEVLAASIPWGYLMGVGGLATAVAAGGVTGSEDPRMFMRQILRGVAAETITVVGVVLAIVPLGAT